MSGQVFGINHEINVLHSMGFICMISTMPVLDEEEVEDREGKKII